MKAIIEAILFSMGEAVEIEKLCTALDADKEAVKEALNSLTEDYESESRGLKLIEVDGSFQLCTKEEAYEYLIKIVSIPKSYRLTDIQLETLSIIAYKQPITKIEIEKIRGVQSDHAINRLIEAGLVEEKGRLATPGRPIILGTTDEFLRRFGLSRKEDLPNIEAEQRESFKLEAEQELGYFSEPVHDENEDVEGQIALELSGNEEETEELSSEDIPSDDGASEDLPEDGLIDVGV
ncbi:MAG: SMC-Scp complex subunit ScpB [Parasporobacterium sp.]|nr:SMC-Scp complex subunit ScpB [Parasporobacterium sp.]